MTEDFRDLLFAERNARAINAGLDRVARIQKLETLLDAVTAATPGDPDADDKIIDLIYDEINQAQVNARDAIQEVLDRK